MGAGSEIAPSPSLRRAAETALAALLAAVGARRARLEIVEVAGEPPWVLSRNEAGESSFARGRAASPSHEAGPPWLPLETAAPPPSGEERRSSPPAGAPRAWVRLDPSPDPAERERLGPSLRLAALLLESVVRLDRHERDEETGLLNRRGLLARLEESLAGDEAPRLALLLLEVEGEGSRASPMRLAASLAGRCLRGGDTLARLEEGILVALLPGADGGEAAAAAGRLQRALRRHEARVPVSAGGLAVAPHHGRNPALLLERASRALDEARRREETTVLLYHEGLAAD